MSEWFAAFRKIPQTPLHDLIRLQITGRLNWRARVAESDLPEVAKRKIVDVVKSTRLWRFEKSQIANELIAHFDDGQSRGLSVDSLVENFGETDTVARLMRSAKKRNRSIFWKTLVAGGYAFLAFLIFYAGLAVWFMSGKPNPSVDYFAVVSADAMAVPEDQRAWPIYREAWIEHDFINLDMQKRVGATLDESWNDFRPGDEKWPAVVEFLGEHESLVKAIRRGGQRPGFGLEFKLTRDYSEADLLAMRGRGFSDEEHADDGNSEFDFLNDALIAGTLVTQYQEMQKMARVLQTDVFRMAESDNADLVTQDFNAMLGLGPQAAEMPMLLRGLVGLALNRLACNTLEEFLSGYPDLLSDQQLKTIAEKMESHSLRKLVRVDGELAFKKDLIQRIYSDDGAGDGRLTDEGLAAIPDLFAMPQAGTSGARNPLVSMLVKIVGPGVAFVSCSRKDLERAVEGAMDEWRAAVGVPFYEQANREPDYFEQLIDKHASNSIAAKTFIGWLMPAVKLCSVAGERAECYRNGTLIGLAAYRFRLRHDRFPETADELVPEFLEQVPVDMVTGQPLHYRLQDGEPLIYSVGQDRDDDGGMEAFKLDGERLDVHRHFDQNVAQPVDGDWILWPFE